MNDQPSPQPPEASPSDPYRVLARKYRPTTFDGLIGQDAMVRTLTNAIASGRLAHAFILTGVRGVGKTTTARIIARALNCIGADGQGGPTVNPCGVCEHCRAIAEDRHVDVLEMDAASRTGIEDIRELIEGVRYRPTSARYKIYIIDEVHMLSRHAFNALLKTLEEPPEHVKFVFATTETRKVPVTVLSRCQRFDLRRVDLETLAAHFAMVAKKEGASVTEPALHLIARAADGSVRDGLSLLDQAISLTREQVGEAEARDMLGLADRSQIFMLMESVLKGEIPAALELLEQQYVSGADPVVVVEDMLDLTHWLTRIKITPAAADGPGVPEMDRVRGRDMAGQLSMAVLARVWQMLLKGLSEARTAPSPLKAVEMVLVRLAYTADLPTPADVIGGAARRGAQASDKAGPPSAAGAEGAPPSSAAHVSAPPPAIGGRPVAALVPEPALAAEPSPAAAKPDPLSFEEVVDLADRLNERILHANLINNVHLVRFEPGRIEFHPGDGAPAELAHSLSRFLNGHTERRWVVTVSREAGGSTLRQQREAGQAAEVARAAENPAVKSVLDAFPGSRISEIRPETPPESFGED